MFGSGSFLVGAEVGAFLKVGSFGFGLGVEKNDESDFASFTAVTGLISFFTTGLVIEVGEATADFFKGGAAFEGGSLDFRFFPFGSIYTSVNASTVKRPDVTHPLVDSTQSVSTVFPQRSGAICARYLKPYP
jgi:hypothetical protein